MHTEHNVWLNTFDAFYHEAVQRETIDSFPNDLDGKQIAAKGETGQKKTSVSLQNSEDHNHSVNSSHSGSGPQLRAVITEYSIGLKDCVAKMKKNSTDFSADQEKILGIGLDGLTKKKNKENYNQENTKHKKLNSCCRLIGEQAISLA